MQWTPESYAPLRLEGSDWLVIGVTAVVLVVGAVLFERWRKRR